MISMVATGFKQYLEELPKKADGKEEQSSSD